MPQRFQRIHSLRTRWREKRLWPDTRGHQSREGSVIPLWAFIVSDPYLECTYARYAYILFATIGSPSDLHRCLSVATELKRPGHSVTVASTEAYRSRVLELGIGFRSLRPNWDPMDSKLIRQCEDLKRGPEILFRKLILPQLGNLPRSPHRSR